MLTLIPVAAFAGTYKPVGNGAFSGPHYNLNIIGVSNDKTATMDDSNGHRIFVNLEGQSKILLTEGDFAVLDANATDGPAKFQLPNPDVNNTGTTTYSVYARALGKPGGSASMVTGATAPGEDGIFGTADDEIVYSLAVLEVERSKGKSSFENVSKYLL